MTVAVMVDVAVAATWPVVMVTVPDVAPAAIVIDAGPVTAVPVALKATVSPPVGAAELIVTVPVVEPLPNTVVGFSVNAVTVGPSIVNEPMPVEPLAVPVMVALVLGPTATVVIVKVPVVCPAAMVVVAGTFADAEPELRLTG